MRSREDGAGGAGAGGEKRARGRGEAEAARQSSSCGLRRRNTAPCGAVADRAQRARRVRSARWAAAHMNLRPFSSLVGSLIVRGRCAASKNQHEDRPAKPDVSRSSRRRALITRLHGGQQHPAGVRHQGGGLGPRRAGARRIFLDLRRLSGIPFAQYENSLRRPAESPLPPPNRQPSLPAEYERELQAKLDQLQPPSAAASPRSAAAAPSPQHQRDQMPRRRPALP